MNQQERLFLAIGAADPALVARSEKRRRRRLLPLGLAAAACLAAVLALGRMLPPGQGPDTHVPADTQNPPVAIRPLPPEDPDSDSGMDLLPKGGEEIGTLRLLRCVAVPSSPADVEPPPQGQTDLEGQRPRAVDFLIYVNEEQFSIQEEDGRCAIQSLDPLPEELPACGLEIAHLSGTAPGQARQEAEAALGEQYPELSEEEPSAALPGSLYLRASQGADWDSPQAELWFVDDGKGGAFVLTARYFLEAEEGLGGRFRDMVSSFRVVDLSKAVPAWMRELYETADRLFPALLSGDLSGVSDLLEEGAQAEAYGEDVWPEVTVLSLDYAPDDGQNPSRATVSVKHRLNRVEGDSVSFLTMELVRRDGRWRLSWSGIEK